MKVLLSLCGLILALASTGFAQTEKTTGGDPAKPQEQEPIRLQSNLVNLNIKVTDIGGRPIVDLQREDFSIFENGEAQEITFFEPVSAPINLLLLLDMSGSTRDKRKVLLQAAKNFVDALGKDDRIAVAAFTRRFHLLSEFTADHKQLKKRIDKAKDINGGTSYYDAMWQALNLLSTVKDSRKAVVVLTDGVDNSLFRPGSFNYVEAGHDFDELLSRAEEDDATVYPIYLNTLEPPSSSLLSFLVTAGDREAKARRERAFEEEKKIYELAHSQMQDLAEATAGTLFEAASEKDLDGVYQKVAAELHQFYSLAYAPKKDLAKGEFRKLSVKVKRDGARAQTRRGYQAK